MFGSLVVLYLFLGGFGAGILFVTALWSLMHRSSQCSQGQTRVFDDLKARCFVVGFVVLCLAALCLLLDLGRPDRAFMLFTRPTLSVLSLGSFALLATLVVGAFLVMSNLLYLPFVHARARVAAEALCVPLSLLMMGYTGVYVANVEAVALWFNVAVPALFVLSSLSAGLSAVFILGTFSRDAYLLDEWTLRLHRGHLVVLMLEGIALGAFLMLAFVDPFAHESLALLLDPQGLGPWFVVGLGVLGLVVPLATEACQVFARMALRPLPVDALCILGGLILRFCVVWSGIH